MLSFYTGWTRAEISELTYGEAVVYIENFARLEAEKMFDFFKAFCIYNAESSAVAFGSEKSRFSKYLADVKRRSLTTDDQNDEMIDLERQFEGVDFGK